MLISNSQNSTNIPGADYPEALKWTQSAEDLVGTLDIPRYEYRHWMEELEHRKKRLQEKSFK